MSSSCGRCLLPTRLSRLSGPLPVSNLLLVDAFRVSVVNARDDLTLQQFLDVGSDGTQTWDTIDDVNC
jgi:hypothetical protein